MQHETHSVSLTVRGYFSGAMSKAALKTFFHDVAAASPLPVLIYNYPGAAGGIDMDSDLINEIAQDANISGCKLTCGGEFLVKTMLLVLISQLWVNSAASAVSPPPLPLTNILAHRAQPPTSSLSVDSPTS